MLDVNIRESLVQLTLHVSRKAMKTAALAFTALNHGEDRPRTERVLRDRTAIWT